MNRNFPRIPDGSIEGGRPFWMMTVIVIIFCEPTIKKILRPKKNINLRTEIFTGSQMGL